MCKLLLYRIKSLAKNPTLLFWSFCFPILLGTMFHFAFGSITERTESFSSIPVAIVKEDGKQEAFLEVLGNVSADGDEPLLEPQYVEEEKAKSLLDKGKVDGIIYAGDELTLTVAANDIEQSILKSFLDQYLQSESTITKISMEHPEQVEAALSSLFEDVSYTEEEPSVTGEMDPFIHYFYALIAMGCLYGCFYGLNIGQSLQPVGNALGARRMAAPMKKGMLVAIDFLASLLLHFAGLLVLLFYLTAVLGKSFGNRWPPILLVMLVGCMAGIGFGTFVGAAVHKSMNVKVSITLSVTMLLCFFGGLMMGDMQNIIEHRAPILNRLNPAALINDALYCLSVYDDYTKFAGRLGILAAISLALIAGSGFVLRRKRYASL